MSWAAWTKCAGKYNFLEYSTAQNKKTCKIQHTPAEGHVLKDFSFKNIYLE